MEEESLEEEESSHLLILSLPGKFNPYQIQSRVLELDQSGLRLIFL